MIGTAGFTNPFQKPLGYQQYTSLSSATNLSGYPAGATSAIIYVEGAAIRWRDDGTAPTTTVGMPVSSGQDFQYTGDFSKIQFIQQTASATINVSYYA